MTAQSGLGFSGIVAIQIPDAGLTGEVLTKLTGDDYDYDWAAGGGGGAPDDAQYVVLALDATLTNERVLTAGTGIAIVDGGAGSTVTLNVDLTLQEAYDNLTTVPQITVNATPDPVTIDASVAGDIFAVRDVANTDRIRISTTAITFFGAYSFPTADGALNEVLRTDGAGTLSFVAGSTLGITLQDAYDAAPAEPQISAAAGDPVGFEPAADPGDIFFLQRADTGRVFLVESLASGYEFTLGPAGNRSWVLSEPTTTSNPTTAQIIPDGRTKTVLPAADNSAIIYWDSTFISNIPGGGGIGNDSGFGAIFLIGTLELLEQGNLFSTSIVFNQATRVDVTAANSGPVYTMVNQPVMRNFGATNRTVSQANAVRSQLRIEPNSTGDVTQTSHEAFFATVILDSSISTGDAFCTTCNYFAAKAPGFLGVGGVLTTLNCLDIANIPAAGITNLRGINSAMASGIFINHTGVAPSFFAGTVELDDSVILQLGDTSGAQFSRVSSSGFRVEGFGGANNEGLDFAFQTADNINITPTAAAGINVNSVEFAFGPSAVADGTNNWVMIFAPGLRATALAGDYSEVLFSSASSISIAHAITTFATWTVNAPTAVIGAGSVVNAANVNIQTSMAVGTNRYGLLVTSNPSGGTLNYAARFTGSTGVRIDGLFEHTGTLLGVFGATPAAQSAAYTPTNVTTDRAYDANATTVDELADVLGTLIGDLQVNGFIG